MPGDQAGEFKEFTSEGQLAYVISHEMADQLKHHIAASTARSQLATILILAAAIAVTAAIGSPQAPQLVTDLVRGIAGTAIAGFSRADEEEADQLAVQIMEAAGYEPHERCKRSKPWID